MTEPHGTGRQGTRLDHIDALRGIAVAAVFAQHVAEKVWQAQPSTRAIAVPLQLVLFQGINLGRFGVILFFLVSGFVVPFAFRGARPVRSFAISRLFRLYPAYWLSILGSVVLAAAFGPPIPGGQVLANLSMVQRLLGVANIRDGYWTLFFELVFYGLVTVLFALGLLRRVGVVGGIAVACLALAVVPAWLRHGLGWHIPSPEDSMFLAYMTTGTMLRMASAGDAAARRWAVGLVLLLLAAAPVLGGAFFPVSSNGNPFFSPIALTSAYPAALLLFVAAVRLQRPRSIALNRLGLVSYSVYLGHGLVLRLLEATIPPTTTLASELAFVAAAAGLSLLLAAVGYRYVERPCIALGRRLTANAVPLRAAEVAP